MPDVGRPLKYSVDELQKLIQHYFNLTDQLEWTVTGLALLVGSKQTLADYGNRDEYKDMVREAKLKVENAYEISLRKTGKAGDIFALKNFGWQDKSEVESTHLVAQMPPVKIGGDPLTFDVGTEQPELEDKSNA